MSDLEERLLQAVHDVETDFELLAHEVAASDEAQVYLIELIDTLSSLNPQSKAADRAVALLEHSMAIGAEHSLEHSDNLESVTRATMKAQTKKPGDDSGR